MPTPRRPSRKTAAAPAPAPAPEPASPELAAALGPELAARFVDVVAGKPGAVLAGLAALGAPPAAMPLVYLEAAERLASPWAAARKPAQRALVAAQRAARKQRAPLPPVRELLAALAVESPYGVGVSATPLLALLERAAPALIARGEPLDLVVRRAGWPATLELELVDRALELGIPLADPREGDALGSLALWNSGGTTTPLRDPLHVAADPRFAPLLARLVESLLFPPPYGLAGRPPRVFALRALRDVWPAPVLARIRALQGAALGRWSRHVPALAAVLTPEALAASQPVRDALADLVAHGAREALARTVRGGLAGELGWEAFDAVAEGFTSGPGAGVSGAFPFVVVRKHGESAVVVGPRGVAARFEPLPDDAGNPRTERFVGGALFTVCLPPPGRAQRAWWSTEREPFAVTSDCFDSGFPPSVPVGADGVNEGTKVVRPGDRAPRFGWGDLAGVMSDGERVWALRGRDDAAHVVELDPATGAERGRALPPFLAEYAVPGTRLVLSSCYLLPCADVPRDNALGARDGMIGFRARVRVDDPDAVECETLDGRRWSGRTIEGRVPVALLRMPGVERDLPATREVFELFVYDPDGRDLLWSANMFAGGSHLLGGVPRALGLLFWALRTPRDAAASRALRAVTADALAGPLERARAEARATRDREFAARAQAVAAAARAGLPEALPAVQHARMRDAVAHAVATAALYADQLGAVLEGA